jgi:hypothetical protein
MAAREMGGLSLADALLMCELLANANPSRYEDLDASVSRHVSEGVAAAGDRTPQRATLQAIAAAVLRPRTRRESGYIGRADSSRSYSG